MQHLFQAAMSCGEEVADLALRCPVQPAGRGEVVDEVPVALVGRDPPGRGVGLDQVALAFER